MKKIVSSLVALSMLLTTMTGCGSADESAEGSETSFSVQSTAATNANNMKAATETSTRETDSAAASETDTASSAPSDNPEKTGSYEDALRELYRALNENNSDQILRLMYPNQVADCIDILAEAKNALTSAFGETDAGTTYEFAEIVKEDAIPDAVFSQLMDNFDQLIAMADLVKTYGDELQSMPAEQLEALYESKLGKDNKSAHHAYTITEGYDVTVRFLQNGEPKEDSFYAYLVQGEGWKFDNSLRKYLRKSKQSLANANAKSIISAFNCTLVDLDALGTDVTGDYLISSDDNKNYHVPASVDVKEVRESLKKYFSDVENYDYFALMLNGACAYVAVCAKDETDYLGTYPISCMPKAKRDHSLETEAIPEPDNCSLDTLYACAKKVIQ